MAAVREIVAETVGDIAEETPDTPGGLMPEGGYRVEAGEGTIRETEAIIDPPVLIPGHALPTTGMHIQRIRRKERATLS